LSMLAGSPGLGKSQVSLSIAASISSGSSWPVSRVKAPQGDVIILSMEDRAEDTIKPRLEACGANLSRVHIITDVEDEEGSRPFNPQGDLGLLEEAIEANGKVSLVIIDPISAYLGKADARHNCKAQPTIGTF
ncbi:MAG TPA: AAA family ATPase, partial [Hyphomicrobium sp.]